MRVVDSPSSHRADHSRSHISCSIEEQAKKLLEEAFSENEDLSEQELEELAMEVFSDEV